MKSWIRFAVGAALTASAVWTLLELKPAEKWRAAQRAWWA
jgi:hypothetical protein